MGTSHLGMNTMVLRNKTNSDNAEKRFWFRGVLKDLMAKECMTIARLAQLCDCDSHVIEFTLSGRHIPSIDLAERMVNALGYDIEVMPRE